MVLGGTLFAGLGATGTGTSIGGGRGSGPTSPTGAASLSSSEIISMIKKGSGTATESKMEPTRTAAADNMAMMGLAELIRAAHSDRSSLALGVDSEAIVTSLSATPAGLDQENLAAPVLSKLMTSPWAETGSRRGQHANSLESILPACYNVQAPPHAATRIGTFTEETLFYMFYGMPRDRMQEMAARELTLNRGWRFHKELRIWVMPGSAAATAASMTAGISALRMSPAPSTTEAIGDAETASYITFDAGTWSKVRRELPLLKEDALEDRFGTK